MDRPERSVILMIAIDMFLCYWLYDRAQTQFVMVTIFGVIVNEVMSKFEMETVNESVLILFYQC